MQKPTISRDGPLPNWKMQRITYVTSYFKK